MKNIILIIFGIHNTSGIDETKSFFWSLRSKKKRSLAPHKINFGKQSQLKPSFGWTKDKNK